MEVHAHTHPASGGTRKKWTPYFWEFLMLFLAVFCGFLAEYKLEQKIESHREHQFAESLSNDLIADINHLSNIIEQRNIRQIQLDYLMLFLNTLDKVSRPDSNPALLSYSKADLDEINFKIHRMKFNNRGSRDAQRLLKQAEYF